MIKEVLTQIRDGGLLSKSDLANKVGVQSSTLESVFSLLSSKGYLRNVGSGDVSKACMSCSSCTGCMKNSAVCTEYVITEKGKNYLELK
ncbi:MAG: hypothetical protein NWF03_05920 [Candidatus Bathyarchaeota archaeon]|nr:hypothetical protein [Candidatus Bathyarchaeota archaeon]